MVSPEIKPVETPGDESPEVEEKEVIRPAKVVETREIGLEAVVEEKKVESVGIQCELLLPPLELLKPVEEPQKEE